MSLVPWNRNAGRVGVLLGGTGLAPVQAPQPVLVPALFRPWPCTLPCTIAVRAHCQPVC